MFKIIILAIVLAAAGIVFLNFRPQEQQNPEQQVSSPLTTQQAIDKVKSLPAVSEYLTEVPNGRVDENGSEGDLYLIQVYEIKDGHTATFNWYRVDKRTGEIKAEFEIVKESPTLSETYADSRYNLEIKYPANWKINKDTQIFENGDIITVEKPGPTQRPQTEFYDGARFTVGVPVKSDVGLKKVGNYDYFERGNLTYPLFLFAEGKDKDQNQRILQEILASLKVDL